MEEMLFVLLERDVAAPNTIRYWVSERIRLGKNKGNDEQIKEAVSCANLMDRSSRVPDIVANIRSVLRNTSHAPTCETHKQSDHCSCGVYSAQNQFEQLVSDYRVTGGSCNICNRPDCDTPNQKH